jgi:hypothetical protein
VHAARKIIKASHKIEESGQDNLEVRRVDLSSGINLNEMIIIVNISNDATKK